MKSISVYNFRDIELFKLLDKQYLEAVEGLCREACELAGRTPVFFPEYTLHDSVHLYRVAVLEGAILGEKIGLLKQDEVVLLVLAAFYHDIGMVCNENEIARLKKSEDYIAFREEWRFSHPNMEELERMHRQDYVSEKEKLNIGGKIAEMEKAMLTDYLRNRHPEASKQHVLEHLSHHPIIGSLSKDLGEICLSHGMSVEWVRRHPWMSPSRKFLCYVLRLADILDFDGDRTPDVLFKAISFSSPVSLQEWEKHKGVKEWSINENEIAFSMEYSHPAYEKAARDFLGWIDRELEQVHLAIVELQGTLPNYGIIAPTKVTSHIQSKGYEYHDLSFSLSRDEVVKLFLTDELYGDKSLFVRELLQNSLDALRLRKAVKAMEKQDWNEGEVRLRHYLDDEGRSTLECEDNGCGMDLRVIEQYFGRVGRSYYRSNEFERLKAGLKQTGVDFDPCSRFGIGFMSVFMVADLVYVETRKEDGEPYAIEINGLSNLFVIKKGCANQPIGTTVRVIERNTPPAIDKQSDNIQLVETVDSYAVACEFPVCAECVVPGIEDSVRIGAGGMVHDTFLESQGVKGIKTYEVDFSQIDSRLSGKMRQSFLVNQRGHITLRNREARWKRLKDDRYGIKREYTYLTKGGEPIHFFGIYLSDSPYTISCDGISVSGVLGRRKTHEEDWKMGKNEIIGLDKGQVFTLDLRGEFKPELNPARTPLKEIPEMHKGWAGVIRVVNHAANLLWEKVLNDCSASDMPVFWSYLLIYRASFGDRITSSMISKQVLLDKMYLPVDGKDWIRLSDVASFEETEDAFSVVDKKGESHSIQLMASVSKWVESIGLHTVKDLVSDILYRVAKLRVSGVEGRLVVDNTPSFDGEPRYCMKSKVVPFSGLDDRCIMSISPFILYNENSPLVRLAARVWNVKEKNFFEHYADCLCEKLFDYFMFELKDRRDGFRNAGQFFQYEGALFKMIDRSAVSAAYLPPYYIQGPSGEKFEITEDVLFEWGGEHK